MDMDADEGLLVSIWAVATLRICAAKRLGLGRDEKGVWKHDTRRESHKGPGRNKYAFCSVLLLY